MPEFERNSSGAYTHSASSQESASTPISQGGWKYNPDDPQDVQDFLGWSARSLHDLEADHGYDFSQHPMVIKVARRREF